MGDDNDLSNLRESCGDVLKLQRHTEFRGESLNLRELVRSQHRNFLEGQNYINQTNLNTCNTPNQLNWTKI